MSNTATIANEILRLSLLPEPVLMNTREMMDRFRLSADSAKIVKRNVRRNAAAQGMLWSWDPSIEKFRVAPDNAPDIVRGMVLYAFAAWADQATTTGLVIRGAHAQGYLSDKVRTRSTDMITDAQIQIEQAGVYAEKYVRDQQISR